MGQSSYIRCSEKSPRGGDIGAERSGPGRGPSGCTAPRPVGGAAGRRAGGAVDAGRLQGRGNPISLASGWEGRSRGVTV